MSEMQFRNEAAFTDAVIDLAKMNGWWVHHDRMRQNVQGTAGFPDICAARNGQIIFAELKMPKGKLSAVQAQWWLAIRHDWYCWLPSDWDTIVQVLSGR